MPRPGQLLYRWVRELHLYVGMFIGPFVLVFAISAMLFNHAWNPSDHSSKAVVHEIHCV